LLDNFGVAPKAGGVTDGTMKVTNGDYFKNYSFDAINPYDATTKKIGATPSDIVNS
jgi:hypothetical protein